MRTVIALMLLSSVAFGQARMKVYFTAYDSTYPWMITGKSDAFKVIGYTPDAIKSEWEKYLFYCDSSNSRHIGRVIYYSYLRGATQKTITVKKSGDTVYIGGERMTGGTMLISPTMDGFIKYLKGKK